MLWYYLSDEAERPPGIFSFCDSCSIEVTLFIFMLAASRNYLKYLRRGLVPQKIPKSQNVFDERAHKA